MGKHHCSSSESTTIIETILSDVNAIIPNFFTLAEGYRLLVGAAEDISQMPNIPSEIYSRSVIRCDHAGTLIDILLELLCCKISFSSQFLSVTCAPVDIIEQLSNCKEFDLSSHQAAERIVVIEAMRRILARIDKNGSSFEPPPIIKPEPPIPPEPSPPETKPNHSPAPSIPVQSEPPPGFFQNKKLSDEAYVDTETEVQADLATETNFVYISGRSPHQESRSPLSRKHI